VIIVPVLWRSSASGRELGNRVEGSVAHRLWDKVGVLSEAVAGAFDLHDDRIVQQAVEECGGDDGVAEDLAPFGKAAVGGEDHGAAFVARVDQLEEQVAGTGADREIADLVDDQQRGAAEKADALAQAALAFGACQRGDDVGEREEVDAAAGADRLDAERDGEVGLSGARRPEQMQHLVAIDEVQLRQGQDAVAVEGGLEREVVALQRLDVASRAMRCAALMRRP